ncbi:MAG: metallophosphoesterase [Planctomycetes bacterium]|nr:metallophosphoesterase [Planctomycetota bacterium]
MCFSWVRVEKRKGGVSLAVWATLLAAGVGGCGAIPGVPLPPEATGPLDTSRFALLARFAHISDAQIVDEESPGRLAAFADLTLSAWRPYEAYSTQLFDGMIRTVNKWHVARQRIDFLIHTGDALDNVQYNELQWFFTCLDGGRIDPRSGPDDRRPEDIPEPQLDPHHPFDAQGLYRRGVHGDLPTIAWYGVMGNHDHFAVGILPIVTPLSGHRISPLPIPTRIGLFLPLALDPVGTTAWGRITPAHPGPPPDVNLPASVPSHPDRRYITNDEFVAAHQASTGEPPGHGFGTVGTRTWYSVPLRPGLRLIALNTATPFPETPAHNYSEGALSLAQLLFLRQELAAADERGDIVIVATHHPSESLDATLGTAATPAALIATLKAHPCVKLHVAGHWHRHAVVDRGGYVEMVTGSILDPPQQGRIVELWRDAHTGEVELRYRFFSHIEEFVPPDGPAAVLFDDPLFALRQAAAGLTAATPKPGSD